MLSSTELRVKELLQERSWTTKMLAEKTGMSESYLTHIKNGTRRWNEDILKRLAEAFEVHPVELFHNRKSSLNRFTPLDSSFNAEEKEAIVPKMVPLMKGIPSHPSPYNNTLMQVTSGFKDRFVPVTSCDDPDLFCVVVDSNNMKPRFLKGDYLIVSPAAPISSGDIVAVEYGTKTITKDFKQVTYMDDFVILESVNHRHAPVALTKGKENLRFIGKVVLRYQKMD